MTFPYTKTLRDVVDDTLRLCGDFRGTGRNGRRHTWTEAVSAVRACVMQIATETGLLKDTRVIPLVDGQAVYDLPVNALSIVSVSLSGLATGRLVLPWALRDLDSAMVQVDRAGDPLAFYRDGLKWNQVAVVPKAWRDGSSFTVVGDAPVIRSVEDAEDSDRLPYDAEDPLAAVGETAFTASGDDGILTGLWPTAGNLVVVYLRTPEFQELAGGVMDLSIPYHLVKDIKFGAAERLLALDAERDSRARAELYSRLWRSALGFGTAVQGLRGVTDDMRPL